MLVTDLCSWGRGGREGTHPLMRRLRWFGIVYVCWGLYFILVCLISRGFFLFAVWIENKLCCRKSLTTSRSCKRVKWTFRYCFLLFNFSQKEMLHYDFCLFQFMELGQWWQITERARNSKKCRGT